MNTKERIEALKGVIARRAAENANFKTERHDMSALLREHLNRVTAAPDYDSVDGAFNTAESLFESFKFTIDAALNNARTLAESKITLAKLEAGVLS